MIWTFDSEWIGKARSHQQHYLASFSSRHIRRPATCTTRCWMDWAEVFTKLLNRVETLCQK